MEVLRKKISTFRGEGGRIRITDDQLYMEILVGWEQWTGTSKEFYKAIGVSKSGLAGIIGKAKRMKREGYFPADEFREVRIEGSSSSSSSPVSECHVIELLWEQNRLIRFPEVEQLVDFLKKVA